jgi:PhnB protein
MGQAGFYIRSRTLKTRLPYGLKILAGTAVVLVLCATVFVLIARKTSSTVHVERAFYAPVERVWKLWNDPESMKQWWGPKNYTAPVITNDLRVGGVFLLSMRSPKGEMFWNTGTYKEIVMNKKIVSTLSFSDENGKAVTGAELGPLMPYRESPEPHQPGALPPGSENKVMHAVIKIGDTKVMVSDGRCSGKPVFQGFGLTINAPDVAQADRMFAALADGGQVQMPLAKTFFAPRFGMVHGITIIIRNTPKRSIRAVDFRAPRSTTGQDRPVRAAT